MEFSDNYINSQIIIIEDDKDDQQITSQEELPYQIIDQQTAKQNLNTIAIEIIDFLKLEYKYKQEKLYLKQRIRQIKKQSIQQQNKQNESQNQHEPQEETPQLQQQKNASKEIQDSQQQEIKQSAQSQKTNKSLKRKFNQVNLTTEIVKNQTKHQQKPSNQAFVETNENQKQPEISTDYGNLNYGDTPEKIIMVSNKFNNVGDEQIQRMTFNEIKPEDICLVEWQKRKGNEQQQPKQSYEYLRDIKSQYPKVFQKYLLQLARQQERLNNQYY